VYENFDDNTVFIHSDIDEIINPRNIDWVAKLLPECGNNEIIKIPLVYLEGYANLRVFNKYTNKFVTWDESLFFCRKEHLRRTTPYQIRLNYQQPFNIVYPVVDNIRVENMGWHFSYMGTKEERVKKIKSSIHYYYNLYKIIGGGFYSDEYLNHIMENPAEGKIPPSGFVDRVLKKYHHSLLPKEIFNDETLRKYFLGE